MEERCIYTKGLETGRLCLRALCPQDAVAAFAGWTNDITVAHYMPWNLHASIQDTEEWLAIESQKVDSSDTFNWGIVEKSSGILIGTIGINREEDTCELGYCISRKHWNKGYMTEAIQVILSFAEEELGVNSIYARVANENGSSSRVLEKLKFQYVGKCTYASYDEKRVFDAKEYLITFVRKG